jgi:hypothetical protein
MGGTVDEINAIVNREVTMWARVIKDANIVMQ